MSAPLGGDSELALADLVRLTGVSAEALRDWHERGLIGQPGSDSFAHDDAERARLVRLCLRRGVELDAITLAERRDGALTRTLSFIFPNGVAPRVSLEEAADRSGLDRNFARRAWSVMGGREEEGLLEEDVEAFEALSLYRSAGFPEAALLEGTRVFMDSLDRVAEMESRLFHTYVHERLKASGLAGVDLLEATNQSGDLARPLLEPTVLYFHRKGWARAVMEDMVLHLAEETGLVPQPEVPGQVWRAVVFTDLSSFTPLTASMGDSAAAQLLERFSAIVRDAARRHDGQVIKQIGDEFLMVFVDAQAAVACALEVESRTSDEPRFPAVTTGIHWGSLLYREGDYVGSTVNIAARLAAEAERHQILLSASVRSVAAGLDGVDFIPVGTRTLKGLVKSVELFEARLRTGVEVTKVRDPVCGMEMRKTEVAATLTFAGDEHAFCSDVCLRAFVEAPGDFVSAG